MRLVNLKEDKKIVFLFLFVLLSYLPNYGQERINKINTIIDSLRIVENQKFSLIEFGLEPLKYEATEKDSLKLLEIEKLLSDKEIRKRIIKGLSEVFTDDEINELYNFISSTSFQKLFNSRLADQSIANQFKDVSVELERITVAVNKRNKINEPISKFEPIPIDREDGFYATVDYDSYMDEKDIKLEDNPTITKDDIQEVKKSIDSNGTLIIDITLKENSSRSFYLLTKNNISKPIAIVIEKHIISLPIVNGAISGGKVIISGNFSEKEIEDMIEKLKNK